jgi:hypothetical protein
MSGQSLDRRSSAADAVEVSSVFGQLCCLTLDTRRAASPGEPEKEMANCERAAGKRESHFFAPGAKAPAPRARRAGKYRLAERQRSPICICPLGRMSPDIERGPRQGRQGAHRATQSAEAKGRSYKILTIPEALRRHGQNRDQRVMPLATEARAIVARGVRGGN